MKFKTRLWITFVTIIILPVILTSIAFGIISYQVIHKEGLNYGIEINDYTMWSDSISSFGELTDEMFYKLQMQVTMDPSRFMDKEYLSEVNEEIKKSSSYLIVRKEKEIFYSGNETAAKQLASSTVPKRMVFLRPTLLAILPTGM